MSNPAEIESLAHEFVELTGKIKTAEEHLKQTRAALKEEQAPKEQQLKAWQQRKQELTDLLLPAWIEMQERHKITRLAGIELRRGKKPRPGLPPLGSDAYNRLAYSLVDATTQDGKPIVELKINTRALEQFCEEFGYPDGVEPVLSDTLAVLSK